MKNKYPMIVNHIHSSQWALLPEMLDTIHNIVANRIRDGNLSAEDIEARIDKKNLNETGAYTSGKTRVIPIYGVISKRMNIFSAISGGTSTELLKDEIESAVNDDSIESILLDIDSPGGSVDGPFELSDFIYNSRSKKPIHAFANGLMASAAYLIGSAAETIISTQAAQVGSIGIITKHFDYSKRNESDGVSETVITSGKYKAVGSDNKPLSKDDEKYMQDRLDYYYTMFVDLVARNRGVSVEAVSNMAEGRIFIGNQSQEAGLIDGIGTLESCLENLNKQGGEEEMTLDELKKDKDLYAEMRKDVESEMKAKDDGLSERFAKLEAKLSDRENRISALEKENEKREAMRLEINRKVVADKIVASKLSKSTVPVRLYGKISNLIDYSQFMKDEKTEDFEAIVSAEIKDWESLNLNSAIDGLGATSKEGVSNEDSADDELADKLFKTLS